ncbi:hypothetical protein FOVSG1_006735 [Fusarium oxysporum f. sp. vasinfectum]
MDSAPTTTAQWNVKDKKGLDSLIFTPAAPLPKLEPNDVLVKFIAASLNYRDPLISRGLYPLNVAEGVVPGSDGAGTVVAVGSRVESVKPGDNVITLYHQEHQGGIVTQRAINSALGGAVDGVLREYGVFPDTGMVPMPPSLTFTEASTLPCAGLTAWNTLFGLSDMSVKAGDTILTQGTGGVSMFIIQFALVAGARVIATTSTNEKAKGLKSLGVHHVINYKKDPNWGATARGFTPGGEGIDHVAVMSAGTTMEQALEAVKIGGLISMVGFVGGWAEPSMTRAWFKGCTARTPICGSKLQFEDMCKAIEVNKIKPVVDKKKFELNDLKEAYDYLWDQKHVGKVVISLAQEEGC